MVSLEETLYQIFEGTLSVSKDRREQSESALAQLSNECPDLVLSLIRFATMQLPAGGSSSSSSSSTGHPVLLAAAVRVRNVIGRSDWNRNPYFTEGVKAQVRECIIPLYCEPHVGERIRRQFLATAETIMAADYPQRWPGLVPQLTGLMQACAQSLPPGAAAASSTGGAAPQQLLPVLLRLKGVLGALRGCCRLYTDVVRVTAAECDAFTGEMLPLLVQLQTLLLPLWSASAAAAAQQQPVVLQSGASLQTLLEFDPVLGELSHCLRLVIKSARSLLETQWPPCLRDVQSFAAFYQCMVAGVLDGMGGALLPLSRRRLEAFHAVDRAGLSAFLEAPTGGDHFDVFQRSAVWRLFKWVLHLCHKLQMELSHPRRCERAARAAATAFCDGCLPAVVRVALETVRWHSSLFLLTSKAYIVALEILALGAAHKATYTALLLPAAEELMTLLLFPRLAFTSADAELWTANPEEYVRRQTSPAGDIYSARVMSCSVLLALAAPGPKFHDPQLLHSLVSFVINQLRAYAGPAAAATEEAMAAGDVLAAEAARRVDAALYTLFQLKAALAAAQYGDGNVEFVLSTFVVPAARYPAGFLRARSVMVLSVFAPAIEWSGAEAYEAALRAVLPLLDDAEVPVRVQACRSLARLICHPHARAVVTPAITHIVQRYFEVMRVVDSEGVVRTLRRTIRYYQDTLGQWGAELAGLLVEHFNRVLQSVAGGYRALEEADPAGGEGDGDDDGLEDSEAFADVLMAADELLVTLTTLVQSLPDAADADADNIFVRIQGIVGPMLYVVLSHQGGSTFGFMDPVLGLVTTLLARSPLVTPELWRLLPCLYHLALHQGALDYLSQMLPPLDNYICVAPLSFLFTPLERLCGGEGAGLPPELQGAAVTPAVALGRIGEAALASADLRNSEVAAVPKLYDSLLLNYWAQATFELSGGDVPSAADVVVGVVGAIAAAAGGRPRQSPTLRLLFLNTVLCALLADTVAALRALQAAGAHGALWAQYASLALSGGVQEHLRSYDRSLLALSLAGVLTRLVPDAAEGDAPDVDWAAVRAGVCGLLGAGVVTAFAGDEARAAEAELRALTVRLERWAAQGGEWEDEESMEDEEYDDDDDEDDEDDNDYADMDGGEWEEEEEGGADGMSEQLQSLIQQAGRMRGAGGGGNEDDEDFELMENLLADDDFTSPVDAVNAWQMLEAAAAALRAAGEAEVVGAWAASPGCAAAVEATAVLVARLHEARQSVKDVCL